MGIDAQSQRSTKILMNLAAGLDESGKPFADGNVRLTATLRLAASSGAAALDQMQGAAPMSGPAASLPNSAVDVPEQAITGQKGSAARPSDLVPLAGWLDRLKIAKGFYADVALAEYLGISKNQISQWRNGRASPTTDELWRVAAELGANPLLVIASVGYQFSALDKREVWLDLAGTLIPVRAPEPVAPVAQVSVAPAVSEVAPGEAQDASQAGALSAHESRAGLEARGMKWTPEEDARLVEEYTSGIQIPEIAQAHKRTIGAILYRLYRDPAVMPDATMSALCEQFTVKFTKRDAVAPLPTF